MKKIIPLLALTFLLSATGTNAVEKGRIRVLLVAGNEPGESHDYVHNPDWLEQALAATGLFEVTRLTADASRPVSDFLEGLSVLRRADYDVVVLYAYKYADKNDYARRIMDFVGAGGGFVAVHGASGVFTNNAEWLRMIGAKFTGHTRGKFTIDLTVPAHPALAGLPASFEVEDEDYIHRLIAGTERTVLGVIRHRPQGDKPGQNNDSIWTCDHGSGRVFYTALGHGKATWQNPVWQKMIAQAICWSAHRAQEVKLKE